MSCHGSDIICRLCKLTFLYQAQVTPQLRVFTIRCEDFSRSTLAVGVGGGENSFSSGPEPPHGGPDYYVDLIRREIFLT